MGFEGLSNCCPLHPLPLSALLMVIKTINKNTSCLKYCLFLSAGYQSQFEDPRDEVLDPRETEWEPTM